MSTESRPPAEEGPFFLNPLAAMSNGGQLTLFILLTLILTIATVWGGRIWFKHSETLVFATGDANAADTRFANKLAAVLKTNNSRLRLKVVQNPDSARALAQFERKKADLAILRTDAKVPPRARTMAILEHDVLLVMSPGAKKIGSISALKKKKIAVLGDSEADTALVRSLLDIAEGSDAASKVTLAPPNSTLDKLFASSGGYGAVVAISHASRM